MKIILRKKYIFMLAMLLIFSAIVAGCKKNDAEDETEESSKMVVNGEVSSPEDFTDIGVFIDVDNQKEDFTDILYKISGDIAIVSFRYNGIRGEFRASCKYDKYDLAGIEDSSNGDMIVTSVEGYNASLYTLNPGRTVFWSDGTINYSLYMYVTCSDEVVDDILSLLTFENRYDKRADVIQQTDEESVVFAKKIVRVFNDKDLDSLKDMIYYPQQFGNGQSAASEEEVLNLDKDEVFTDILLKALSDEDAIDNIRKTEDDTEYVIGTNYKNVHFRMMDDGNFLITKVNN
jgi:hypothetical protein